jgi:superfamily II DNA or RNA helicase
VDTSPAAAPLIGHDHAAELAPDPATGRTEAMTILLAHASRRGAGPHAEVLAARAIQVTRGADFRVSHDALDALLRRLDSSRDDGLVVRPGPAGEGYRVGRRGKRAPAYDVWIDDAGAASCSCPDFAKAALGLCKHALAAIAGRRRRCGPRALRWDPVRPLTGPGDWLARVWRDPGVALPRRLAALFQHAPAAQPIDPAVLADPSRRRATVELIAAACRRDPRLAEPALLPLLERERAELARRQPIGGRELDRLLRGLKQKLFPYQRQGVERFLGAGRLLLADDMGLGKTAQAIASCHALFAAGKVRRAVVVVPASLKAQWAREWRTFTDLELVTVEGAPDERAGLYRRRGGVLLVNYEQLLRDLPAVQGYAPELVVLDEAQRIKNWETKTAGVVKRLEPAWRLVLTGTPMENRIEELASIMEWVDEPALEPRWRLASWHSVRVDGSREVIGARNLDTLRARLAPSMLRRVRGEVLAQLPPRRDQRISVALSDAQQSAHAELDQPIAALVARTAHRPLTQAEFLRLMQLLTQQRMICNGLALRDFVDVWPTLERSRRKSEALLGALDSPKLLELRDRITDLVVTQQRKVVVFSQWRRMLRLAAWVTADVLARADVRVTFFTGEESQRRRTENLVAFHDDPNTRVLFATDAGGVGLNLQRAASCCINLELPWNPAVLEQRIGRIFRMGQTQPVDIYNLVAASGIEDRIADLVGDKRALFVGLFDGTSDEVPFDSSGSFMTRVRDIVRPERPPAEAAPDDTPDDAPDDAPEAGPDDAPDDAPEAGPDDAPEAGPNDAPEAAPDDAPEAAPEAVGQPPEPAPPHESSPVGPAVRVAVGLGDLTAMMSQIQVRALDDGRISLELPGPAATALGGLLRALAAAVEGTPGAALSA